MSPRILIVDDDPTPRRLLEILVNRFGYSAETVASGAAALERIAAPQEPRVDLIILDLVMPELDGMGVLAQMRADNLKTPVIAMTGHGAIETVTAAMRAGAIDFVLKP